jgi:hypothetical protein
MSNTRKITAKERREATEKKQAQPLMPVEIEPACQCYAYPFAHYHVGSRPQWDKPKNPPEDGVKKFCSSST